MSMLDQQATEALRAIAIARSPEDGAAARAWAAMQQRLVSGPPALDVELDAGPRRARWLVAAFAVAAAVLVAVGLLSWSAGWLAGQRSRSDEQAPYASEPPALLAPEPVPTVGRAVVPGPSVSAEPPRVVPSEPAAAEPSHAVSSEPVATEPASTSPSRRAETRRRADTRPSPEPKGEPMEPAATSTTLEAELRLLGQAKSARRAGRHADALDVLARHANEFPAGQLAPEREYERALVLCELGRTTQARAVADAFARRHPKSPLRAKAEDVCREEDPR